MAKQSGLHQLRGKVGEHSYYRQTGIVPGLVRSINQGLSSRVKTAPEFANTRLNNAEFGHACKIAGVLGHTLMPKFRPMILPFSQSKMAKIIFDAIKLTAGSWGQRSLDDGAAGLSVLKDALRGVVKNDPSNYGFDVEATSTEVTVSIDQTIGSAILESLGADGFRINIIRNNVQVGNYVASLRDYQYSYRVFNTRSLTLEPGEDEGSQVAAPQLPPVPAGQANAYALDVVVIMPFRTVNNVEHILQEACTFMVL